jgi:hypothetical protein
MELKGDIEHNAIHCNKSYKNFDVDIFNSELIQVAFPDIENIETSEQVNS